MSNCDACVGVEAEHHLCDECVQEDIERDRALRAELAATKSELLKYQTHLTKAEAKLEVGRAELAATKSELAKAIAWLDRCQWARNVIDLDAGPLEVQLAETKAREERLKRDVLNWRGEVAVLRRQSTELAEALGLAEEALDIHVREDKLRGLDADEGDALALQTARAALAERKS